MYPSTPKDVIALLDDEIRLESNDTLARGLENGVTDITLDVTAAIIAGGPVTRELGIKVATLCSVARVAAERLRA